MGLKQREPGEQAGAKCEKPTLVTLQSHWRFLSKRRVTSSLVFMLLLFYWEDGNWGTCGEGKQRGADALTVDEGGGRASVWV